MSELLAGGLFAQASCCDFSCRLFIFVLSVALSFALLLLTGLPAAWGCAAYMKLFATSHEK
jgi:hypothetical protein